jgi:uncharacterized protein
MTSANEGPPMNPNIQLVQQYLAVVAARDAVRARDYFADDLVYVVPGRNRLAGVRRGKDAAGAWFADMQTASAGTYHVEKVIDWLGSADGAVLIAEERAAIDGQSRTWVRAISFDFRADKMQRVMLFEDDQQAHDRWLGGTGAQPEGRDEPSPAANSAPRVIGELADPRVQAVLEYQHNIMTGNRDAARRIFWEDVLYTVPGHSLLAGEYRGPDAVMGYLGKLMELTGGTYAISRMHWLTSADRVALVTRNHATRQGRSLSWDELILFTFVGGKKKRIQHFSGDPYAVDELFATGKTQ